MKSLAKASQQGFHHYISLSKAFPFLNKKEELCWRSVVEAAARSETLQATLNSIEGDVAIKRDLIDYVSLFYFLLTVPFDFVSRSGLGRHRYVVSSCLRLAASSPWRMGWEDSPTTH